MNNDNDDTIALIHPDELPQERYIKEQAVAEITAMELFTFANAFRSLKGYKFTDPETVHNLNTAYGAHETIYKRVFKQDGFLSSAYKQIMALREEIEHLMNGEEKPMSNAERKMFKNELKARDEVISKQRKEINDLKEYIKATESI